MKNQTKEHRIILKNGHSLVSTILLACLCHSPAWAQNEISTPYLISAKNFRDIAGISSTYGGTGFANDTSHNGIMRTGVFYRSSELGGLNSNDLVTLSNLGISRLMDLRTPSEILASPEVHLNGASEVNFNIFGTYKTIVPPMTSLEAVIAFAHSGYQELVTGDTQRAVLKSVFLDLANTSRAELYHCVDGKDRTGWVSVVLESIAGVSTPIIMKDYLASNSYTGDITINELLASPPALWPTLIPTLGVQSDFLQAGLDQVIASYGSMSAYLTQGLGLTQADIYVLRAKMVYYQTLPGQTQFSGNAAAGAAFLNSLQNSPLSGHYTAYNYYLQSAIDAGTLGGLETRVGGQVLADAGAYILRQPQLIDDALTPNSNGQNLKYGETNAWLSGIAGYQEASGRPGVSTSNDRNSGLIVGGTHRFNDHASAYLGAGFISNKVESAGANADVDNYLGLFGGRYAFSALETGPYVGVRFSVGTVDYESNRPLDNGLGTASGKTDGKTYSGRVDFGDIFDLGTFTLTPQVGVLIAHADLDGFNEQDSELALNFNSISKTVPSLLAELHVDFKERKLSNWVVKPSAMIGYERALDTSQVTSAGSLYGYSVNQESAYDSQDLAKLGVGVVARNGAFSVSLGANAMVGENIEGITGANINLAYAF